MELVKAVVKYTDNPNEDNYRELLSELADVTILTKQLGFTEGYNNSKHDREFYNIVNFKCQRTIDIIRECQQTGKTYEEVRKGY